MRLVAIIAAVFVSAIFFAPGSRTVQALAPAKVHSVEHRKTQSIKTKKHKKAKIVTVKPGDYLGKIAKKNHTTFLRLFYANKQIKDPDLIFPGQKLKVPAKSEHLKLRPLPGHASVIKRKYHHVTSNVKPAVRSKVHTHAAPTPTVNPVSNYGIWDKLAACESGGNWQINTGNGFYGGLQFTISSWHAVGGFGYPNQASKAEQITRAQILQARQGWGAWPICSAKLGLG